MVIKCGLIWSRWEGAPSEQWQKQSKTLRWFWFVFVENTKKAEIVGKDLFYFPFFNFADCAKFFLGQADISSVYRIVSVTKKMEELNKSANFRLMMFLL